MGAGLVATKHGGLPTLGIACVSHMIRRSSSRSGRPKPQENMPDDLLDVPPPPKYHGESIHFGIIIEKTGQAHGQKVLFLFSPTVSYSSGKLVCSFEFDRFEVGDWIKFRYSHTQYHGGELVPMLLSTTLNLGKPRLMVRVSLYPETYRHVRSKNNRRLWSPDIRDAFFISEKTDNLDMPITSTALYEVEVALGMPPAVWGEETSHWQVLAFRGRSARQSDFKLAPWNQPSGEHVKLSAAMIPSQVQPVVPVPIVEEPDSDSEERSTVTSNSRSTAQESRSVDPPDSPLHLHYEHLTREERLNILLHKVTKKQFDFGRTMVNYEGFLAPPAEVESSINSKQSESSKSEFDNARPVRGIIIPPNLPRQPEEEQVEEQPSRVPLFLPPPGSASHPSSDVQPESRRHPPPVSANRETTRHPAADETRRSVERESQRENQGQRRPEPVISETRESRPRRQNLFGAGFGGKTRGRAVVPIPAVADRPSDSTQITEQALNVGHRAPSLVSDLVSDQNPIVLPTSNTVLTSVLQQTAAAPPTGRRLVEEIASFRDETVLSSSDTTSEDTQSIVLAVSRNAPLNAPLIFDFSRNPQNDEPTLVEVERRIIREKKEEEQPDTRSPPIEKISRDGIRFRFSAPRPATAVENPKREESEKPLEGTLPVQVASGAEPIATRMRVDLNALSVPTNSTNEIVLPAEDTEKDEFSSCPVSPLSQIERMEAQYLMEMNAVRSALQSSCPSPNSPSEETEYASADEEYQGIRIQEILSEEEYEPAVEEQSERTAKNSQTEGDITANEERKEVIALRWTNSEETTAEDGEEARTSREREAEMERDDGEGAADSVAGRPSKNVIALPWKESEEKTPNAVEVTQTDREQEAEARETKQRKIGNTTDVTRENGGSLLRKEKTTKDTVETQTNREQKDEIRDRDDYGHSSLTDEMFFADGRPWNMDTAYAEALEIFETGGGIEVPVEYISTSESEWDDDFVDVEVDVEGEERESNEQEDPHGGEIVEEQNQSPSAASEQPRMLDEVEYDGGPCNVDNCMYTALLDELNSDDNFMQQILLEDWNLASQVCKALEIRM